MLLPGFFRYAGRLGYKRRWFLTILFLQLLAVVFEGIGVGIILPILEFVKSGGDMADLATESRIWRILADLTAYVGISVNLPMLLFVSFATVVLRQCFVFLREVYVSWVTNEMQRQIRGKGFENFLSADLNYHDRINTGGFVNEMTTELVSGLGLISNGTNFIGTLLLMAVYVGIVFMLSPELTLVALSVLLGVSLLLVRYMSRIRELGRLVTSANQQMSVFLLERLKAVRLVRLSGVAQAEEDAFNDYTLEQRNRNYQRTRMVAFLTGLVEPIIMAIALVFLYYAVNVLQLELEIIVLFFFILIRLIPLTKSAIQQRQAYLAVMASVDVILRRFDELEANRDPAGGAHQLVHLNKAIEFKNVSFSYPESAQNSQQGAALRNISLTIPAGKVTALVGPSGAGKSTLVELLPRLRTPQLGEILYDGISQHSFSTKSLRQAVAVAPQLAQIFDVTVNEHIRYGKPDASRDEVVNAAKLAHAHDFIESLPEGYDTRLNSEGTRISGGERQRVDLARTLIRRAPIIVLDEPTANLDAVSEARFRSALDKIRSSTEITVVIIAHRLSTVKGADQIIVLNNGEVVETGSHQELLAHNDWYGRAFMNQLNEDSTFL